MTRLSALILTGCLTACGGATGDDLFDRVRDTPGDEPASMPATDAQTTTARASTRQPTPAPPAPSEPEPDPWRTCLSDDECDLKASACLPLEPNGTRYCRRLRATVDQDCDADEDCELGLECRRFDTTAATHCLPVQGTPNGDRWPLSCEPGPRAIDAHCEAE